MKDDDVRRGADWNGVSSGLLFLVLGVAAVLLARSYDIGSATQMGPGYFPHFVGWLMVALSLLRLVFSRHGGSEDSRGRQPERLRPLVVVIAALLAFAWLAEHAGLLFALPSLVLIASFAREDRRWKEVVLMAAALTAFTILVFVIGLGVRLPIIARGLV